MNTLPYELLQHVASNLLPRYQCRLAMASRHHYNYLYNDLLRWHVKRACIRPPRFYHVRKKYPILSLLVFNKNLVIYDSDEPRKNILQIRRLTRSMMYFVDYYVNLSTKHTRDSYYLNDPRIIRFYITMIGMLIRNRSAYKNPLSAYLTHGHPLASLSGKIIDNITQHLDSYDAYTFLYSSMNVFAVCKYHANYTNCANCASC